MNNISNFIDTDKISIKYREAAINLEQKKLLITNLKGTEQEKDLTEPANCNGFGRIRHFRLSTNSNWIQNPLPIVPACKKLGFPSTQMLRAQVFQNAVCNWRCWYCYVPFDLLTANKDHSSWLAPSDLIDFYLRQDDPPTVIDLSGGQPDLTPEWVPWMMSELRSRGLDKKVYLWSDDNLSNDYFWKYLSKEDIALVASYENYGRVCCFKGFDSNSFNFNTKADPQLFDRQFSLMKKFIDLGIDVYAYVTFTTPSNEDIPEKIHSFMNHLQQLDNCLPLRTIPLEIRAFTPVTSRLDLKLDPTYENSMQYQYVAIDAWKHELQTRYTEEELSKPISDILIGGNN